MNGVDLVDEFRTSVKSSKSDRPQSLGIAGGTAERGRADRPRRRIPARHTTERMIEVS